MYNSNIWGKIPAQVLLGPGSQNMLQLISFVFNWSIVDLQCRAHLCCTAKWLSYTHTDILFHVLFHDGLSQATEYSSLCYTVGPCCLSILYIIVSQSFPPPWFFIYYYYVLPLNDSQVHVHWKRLVFFLFFNWSVVDLQCFVSFRCTAKWFSYVYVYVHFHVLFHGGLLQDIEYSSLGSTVGPCYLSYI